MHLDRTARRVLGSLVEKRLSTPEQYPLTLNALVLACNQRSNRDPVLDLEEFEVRGCLTHLRIAGYAVEMDAARVPRFRERLCESLGLTAAEAPVVAELLLRGPQTEQELARRCPRMTGGPSTPEAALAVLEGLAGRKLVEHLPRRPGERIARWRHLFTPSDEAEHVPAEGDPDARRPLPRTSAPEPAPYDVLDTHASSGPAAPAFPGSPLSPFAPVAPAAPVRSAGAVEASGPDTGAPHPAGLPRDELREEVAALRREVAALRAEVAELRSRRDA